MEQSRILQKFNDGSSAARYQAIFGSPNTFFLPLPVTKGQGIAGDEGGNNTDLIITSGTAVSTEPAAQRPPTKKRRQPRKTVKRQSVGAGKKKGQGPSKGTNESKTQKAATQNKKPGNSGKKQGNKKDKKAPFPLWDQ